MKDEDGEWKERHFCVLASNLICFSCGDSDEKEQAARRMRKMKTAAAATTNKRKGAKKKMKEKEQMKNNFAQRQTREKAQMLPPSDQETSNRTKYTWLMDRVNCQRCKS